LDKIGFVGPAECFESDQVGLLIRVLRSRFGVAGIGVDVVFF